MDALVIHAPGDLRIEAVETPPVGAGQARIRVRAGGICGFDLHYFQHGGFGAIRLQQPMVLGHEIAGVVEALGAGVTGLAVGQQVAVNPSRPCAACRFCQLGLTGGESPLPMNRGVTKEFDLRGASRFHAEFGVAVGLINKGLVKLKPLVLATLPYRDAGRAFALAADRSQSMKVVLDFG